MSTKEGQHIWRLIDQETGKFQDYAGCPNCDDKEDVIVQLEKDLRVLKGRLTRLERNEKAEAERHKRWDEAEAIYDWWRLACNHPRAKFSHEDFKDMLPRLKEVGPIGVLQGIAGAAFDPSEKPLRNGGVERFDSIELICRSAAKLESFASRVPGGEDSNAWRIWLVRHIESGFKENAPAAQERSGADTGKGASDAR